jgi:hypothetical protein
MEDLSNITTSDVNNFSTPRHRQIVVIGFDHPSFDFLSIFLDNDETFVSGHCLNCGPLAAGALGQGEWALGH